jgi:hypothetical protein
MKNKKHYIIQIIDYRKLQEIVFKELKKKVKSNVRYFLYNVMDELLITSESIEEVMTFDHYDQ